MVIKMVFSLFDGGDDTDYNGAGWMEISNIFAMQDAFLSLKGNHLTNFISPKIDTTTFVINSFAK